MKFQDIVEEMSKHFKGIPIVELTTDGEERAKDIRGMKIRWNEPHWKESLDGMVSRIKQLETAEVFYWLSSTQDTELWWLKNKLKEIEQL